MLKEYKIIEKDDKDLILDKIKNRVSINLGWNDFYVIGAIELLDRLLSCIKKDSDTISKDNLIACLKSFFENKEYSSEVIEYVSAVLKKYE